MSMPNIEELQQQLGSIRDRLEEYEIVGTAAGGGVHVRMTVTGDFKDVRIDPEVHATGPEEVGDAVLLALRDAAEQLREHVTRQMGGLQDLLGKLGSPDGV
jgi:nucleoid-associated protein EbfC